MMRNKILTILILCAGTGAIQAQPRTVNYASLANRASAPVFFFDEVLLPGNTDSTAALNFIFRMDNDFLAFKKINYAAEPDLRQGYEFYSTARINSEIFTGTGTKGEFTTSVARDVWQDTVYARNFEETQTKQLSTAGFLQTELSPGHYEYLLQLSMLGEAKDRNSTRNKIRVEDLKQKKNGEIILLKSTESIVKNEEIPLLNLGDNVHYGEDFSVLVRIPEYSPDDSYTLEIAKAVFAKKDTTSGAVVYSVHLQQENIFEGAYFKITNSKNPSVVLTEEKSGLTYAMLKIPNSKFQNSAYRITLKKQGSKADIASRLVRSYWPEMPPGLLNLDIAINMLKFILPQEEIKKIQKGTESQKEANFREFWASKDPTPDTEYNELMTEYYRRIDYSFKEFSNIENPEGQETDRGKIYIQFGPPNSTERQFPSKGKVIETWKYDGQTFVFEKGAGFSDFKLVARN